MAALADEITRFGTLAFCMTVTPEAKPHVGPVNVEVDGAELLVRVLPGSRTERNVAAHETVCLHWPGTPSTDDYSLIVDGPAMLERDEHETRLRITPTKAVLHRLGAPGEQTTACGHDCQGVDLP
jgi:hypothetical protein